jgi:esterase/lipase
MSGPEPVPASRARATSAWGALRRLRARWVWAVLGVGLVGALVLGPRAEMGELRDAPIIGDDVDAYIRRVEAVVPGVRPGAEKHVGWLDSTTRAPTPLAIVYVHGFTADRNEVEPLVTRLGRTLGANVYFTRLTGHGRDGGAMAEATTTAWLHDVAEAVAIGRAIGGRVLLVGTSTGGALATWAVSRPELASDVAALVLLSPNFHPRDRMSRLLLWPWGGVLARLVVGDERCFPTHNEVHARYWTSCHATEALLPMMALTEHVRTSALEAIRTPTLVIYVPDDGIVDSRETERAFERFGSDVKALFRVEAPGDPDRHVPAGDALSPGTTDLVLERIRAFMASLPQ